MPNYANGKIYKIWSLSTDEIYVGSTVEPLSKRMTKHRDSYKRYQKGKSNYITSFKILEYGDARIELIEKVDCKCREELMAREGYYVRALNCVNRCIPGRTRKEYYETNKERLAHQQKQYRSNNKETAQQYNKQYRSDNKEKIALKNKKWRSNNKEPLQQYQQQYRSDNKEKIALRNKKWRENNKDRLRKKITCECGSIVSREYLNKHKKSKRHLVSLLINTRN